MTMKTVEKIFIIIFIFGLFVVGKSDIYIVTIVGEPVRCYRGGISGFEATAVESNEKLDFTSDVVSSYSNHLELKHDTLLESLFDQGTYTKLYSYKFINGFVVDISAEQAETLRGANGVKSVDKDWKVRKLTMHTQQFLELPTGVWPSGGGFDRAGEDIVIGFIDLGIFPHHPSFENHNTEPYGSIPKYRGKYEVDSDMERSFCNRKIVGAQHFAKAAIAAGAFNPLEDYASPMDGDGHGSGNGAMSQ